MDGKIIFQGKTKTDKEIVIRYPTIDDVSAMQNYINTLSKEQTFIRFQGEQMSFEDEKKYVVQELEKIKNKKGVQLLVFHNEELIASSGVDLAEKIQSHIGEFGISVKKEFRGEGIGKLLMEKVIEEAKKNILGLKIIRLGCFATNTKACEMYKSFGFLELGILPGGVLYKGKEEDYIEMYKTV